MLAHARPWRGARDPASPPRTQQFALQLLGRDVIVHDFSLRCVGGCRGSTLPSRSRRPCGLGDDCLLLIQDIENARFIDSSLPRAQARAREALFPKTDRRMAHVGIDDLVVVAVTAKTVDTPEIARVIA